MTWVAVSIGYRNATLLFSALCHRSSLAIRLYDEHCLRAVWCRRNAPFCSSPWLTTVTTPLLFRPTLWQRPSLGQRQRGRCACWRPASLSESRAAQVVGPVRNP